MDIESIDLKALILSRKGLVAELADREAENIRTIARTMAKCLASGGAVYACGNGGSAADAQHIAAELVGRFFHERKALPALALTTNTSILTSVGNDYGYEQVFARQVQAIPTPRSFAIRKTPRSRSASCSVVSIPPRGSSRCASAPA
jgi:phosphoheptose isomerase